MSPAHLRAVPDPEPDPNEEPSPGEGPSSVPTAGPVIGAGLDDVEPGPDEEAAAGEQPDEDQDDEQDTPRDRWFVTAWKYLGLYSNEPKRPVYGPLLVAAGRHSGPFLLRALRLLARGLRCGSRSLVRALLVLARGVGVLLSALYAWTTGTAGPGPTSLAARVVCIVIAGYAVARLATTHTAGPWVTTAAAVAVTALAGSGRLPLPGATKESKTKTKTKTETETAEPKQEEQPRGGVAGMLSRFGSRRDANGTPPTATDTTPENTPEQTEEEPSPEHPSEAPPAPLPVTLIEALNHPRHGGRHVLLTALRDDLRLPDTRAVKGALDEAGIRWRPGVRTAAGSGPGVHASDVPPLPSLQGSRQPPTDSTFVQVSAPTTTGANTANNTANTPGEGLDAGTMDLGSVIIGQDPSRCFRVERPPEPNKSAGS